MAVAFDSFSRATFVVLAVGVSACGVDAFAQVTSDPLIPLGSISPAEAQKPILGRHEFEETFSDSVYGVTLQIPKGWTVRDAPRWGTKENTVFITDPLNPRARPSVYYRELPAPPVGTARGEIEKWLRETADAKAKQRAASLPGYVNRESKIRNIGDRVALTWTASYTQRGEPWAEYLTRIYSPKVTILFFLNAPAKDITAMIPKFESMIQTSVVP